MKRRLLLGIVALAMVALVVSPANAASTRVVCVANGFTDIGGSGPYTWDVFGTGTCLDTLQGNFLVTLKGSGTSNTLGLCDQSLLVQNLRITVNQTFLNLRTLEVTNNQQVWSAPLTLFPVATPFLIGDGGLKGAGAIATRILLGCPPGGNHVSTFAFTTTT